MGLLVYVTNERYGTITVIDTKTDQVVNTIKVGARPRGIRLSPDGRRVWGLGLTPDGKKIYTANGLSKDISVIDTTTDKVISSIKAGDGPW